MAQLFSADGFVQIGPLLASMPFVYLIQVSKLHRVWKALMTPVIGITAFISYMPNTACDSEDAAQLPTATLQCAEPAHNTR